MFSGIALLLHYACWDAISDVPSPVVQRLQEEKTINVQLAIPANTPPAETKAVSPAIHKARASFINKAHVTAASPDMAPDVTQLSEPVTDAQDDKYGLATATQPISVATKNEVNDAPTTISAPNLPLIEKATPDDDVIDLSGLSVLAPPSGKMSMKLVYVAKNMNPVYGVGSILWATKDHTYQMQIDASLDLLLTTLRLYKLQSDGVIGQHGIAPQQMSESRRGRSETATHFNYDTKTISFSASVNVATMSEGAQDKATVFMQLAGLGIADPTQFVTGRKMTIQVAENREAEKFIFVIAGQEEITTPMGKIQTWHVMRPPRLGFYNSTLELWFAPAYHWYPVQIRNTEPNGAVTTQTVNQIGFKSSLEN